MLHWGDDSAAGGTSTEPTSTTSPQPSTTQTPAAKPATPAPAKPPPAAQPPPPKPRAGGKAKASPSGTPTKPKVICTGQLHHAISKTIFKELENHKTLRGVYKERDSRFVTQAIDKTAHRGYQKWHRAMEDEVIAWLRAKKTATPAEFEEYLRNLYATDKELMWRFPNGLP